MRVGQPKRQEEKRSPSPQFWHLFLYVFFSSPGPALCKLGQPRRLFVLLEVLTLVLRPSFVLFSQAFPFFVFQPPPFWTSFSYPKYLTIFNSMCHWENANYNHNQISIHIYRTAKTKHTHIYYIILNVLRIQKNWNTRFLLMRMLNGTATLGNGITVKNKKQLNL